MTIPALPWLALALALLTGTPDTTTVSTPAPPSRGGDLRMQQAPALEVTTLSGTKVNLETYSSRLLVLYFFRADDPASVLLAKEIEFFHSQGRANEIAYLGISTLDPKLLAAFAARENLHHDLASDPSNAIRSRYVAGDGNAAFVVDFQGTVRFFRDQFDTAFTGALRSALREMLGELHASLQALPGLELPWRSLPKAAGFTGTDLEGKSVTSTDLLGRPLLIYFFEAACFECTDVTAAVVEMYGRYAEKGIRFLAVASKNEDGKLTQAASRAGLSFPVLFDPDKTIRRALGSTQGSPDLLWIDATGQARWREFGNPENLIEILDLEAKVLLGTADPAALPPGRYLGARLCRVCHEAEFRDWLGTPHAIALLSLEPGNAYEKAECVSCHVTGHRRPGGWVTTRDARVSHVQCEACHGASGGHVADPAAPAMPYPARCLSCHLGPYALKTSLETALPWMSHRATPAADRLLSYAPQRLPDLERQRNNRRVATTYHGGATYVGSDRCAPCHAELHRTWSESAHARALDALRQRHKDQEPACLSCHTTGYGELSGYRGAATPGQASVGCEVCHGPGSDHVAAPPSLARATIYGLAPACATCQAEATCRTCHDAANDADFKMPAALRTMVHGKPH